MIRFPSATGAICVLTVCLLARIAPASAWEATLEHAADGDSFTVIRQDTRQMVQIRLYGVDAPENGQAFGQASRRSLVSLLRGRTLDIRPMDEDPYGRTVAVVFTESSDPAKNPGVSDTPSRSNARGEAEPGEDADGTDASKAAPLCVNEEQLDRGMVWFYPHFCHASFCRAWQKREQAARTARIGLWRDKNPVRPWSWRKEHPRSR